LTDVISLCPVTGNLPLASYLELTGGSSLRDWETSAELWRHCHCFSAGICWDHKPYYFQMAHQQPF